MAIMLGKLYDALRLGTGISDHARDAAAREAAEEVALYDARLAMLDSQLKLVQWMVGTNVAITLGILWLAFTILGRLPR
jgi:hypothetical protein